MAGPNLTRAQALDVAAVQRAVEAEDDLLSRRLVDSYERGRAAAIGDDLRTTRGADASPPAS